MDNLPGDVLKQILAYLQNDGTSVGRLSLCSRPLNDRIHKHSPDLWIQLCQFRWSTLKPSSDYRLEYVRRHAIDRRALNALKTMTEDLQALFAADGFFDMVEGSSYVGQAWGHPMWKMVVAYRSDITDLLKRHGRQTTIKSPIEDRLSAFLAARFLQNIHFADCLYEWKAIHQLQQAENDDPHKNSILLERYSILVCEIQQTPLELLDDQISDISHVILHLLDQLAGECRQRIEESKFSTVVQKVQIVNQVLVQNHGFQGNSENYYDYRNSLLHCVLESKKGIPITLCILYSCICRRLDIQANLIGLPGHVVLGFYDENGDLQFMDVFRGGQVLTLQECQRICASYGVPWNPNFATPLQAPLVLTRILNNLTNCHFQAMRGPSSFHSDLFFQQRALASIHRQPPGIAAPLVERVTQETPLTLSPDLLRYYGLLSPPRPSIGEADMDGDTPWVLN